MYDNNLQIKSTKTGKGVFTNIQIPINSPILEFGGELNIEKNPSQDVLQIGPNFYLSPSGNLGDKIRHSCNPNCYLHIVGQRAILYSAYVIQADSELTFDYSTSSTDTTDTWQMNCQCGSYNCRKIISGFDYLNDDIKTDYKSKGLIPLFMNHNIFMKK
jgi:hypothetical protein